MTAALEIGSEFEWPGIIRGPWHAWPAPAAWFARGRDAIVALVRASARAPCRVHVPDYFCPEVAAHWRAAGLDLVRYADRPDRREADFESLSPGPGDLVIAVNYFGTRAGEAWGEWRDAHPDVVLAEDHTHDLFSPWAANSRADFCFASCRKTFPAPDGAILWSPRGRALPGATAGDLGEVGAGSAMKLAAMMIKREYLARRDSADLKSRFRRLQLEGERRLQHGSEPEPCTPWSRDLLGAGYPGDWLEARAGNARWLLDHLPRGAGFEPLFDAWPAGATPYAVLLRFADPALREIFRARLVAAGVYVAVHWPLEQGDGSPAAIDLARRLLTIPVDQRYRVEDLEQVAALLATGG